MAARVALLVGAFYGMTGVILGAMGAHALRSKLSASLLSSYQVGARYQLFHAVVLLCLGLLALRGTNRALQVAIGCVIIGTFCFSGSIYALTVLRWKAVALVTPLGGVFLIIGWGALFVAVWGMTRPGEQEASS